MRRKWILDVPTGKISKRDGVIAWATDTVPGHTGFFGIVNVSGIPAGSGIYQPNEYARGLDTFFIYFAGASEVDPLASPGDEPGRYETYGEVNVRTSVIEGTVLYFKVLVVHYSGSSVFHEVTVTVTDSGGWGVVSTSSGTRLWVNVLKATAIQRANFDHPSDVSFAGWYTLARAYNGHIPATPPHGDDTYQILTHTTDLYRAGGGDVGPNLLPWNKYSIEWTVPPVDCQAGDSQAPEYRVIEVATGLPPSGGGGSPPGGVSGDLLIEPVEKGTGSASKWEYSGVAFVGSWTFRVNGFRVFWSNKWRIGVAIENTVVWSDEFTVSPGAPYYARVIGNSFLKPLYRGPLRMIRETLLQDLLADRHFFEDAGGVEVEVIDNPGNGYYNRCTDFSGDLTLSVIASGSVASPTLIGTTSKPAVNGMVTFDDIKVKALGYNHRLRPGGTGLTQFADLRLTTDGVRVYPRISNADEFLGTYFTGRGIRVKVKLCGPDFTKITDIISPIDRVYPYATGGTLVNEFAEYDLVNNEVTFYCIFSAGGSKIKIAVESNFDHYDSATCFSPAFDVTTPPTTLTFSAHTSAGKKVYLDNFVIHPSPATIDSVLVRWGDADVDGNNVETFEGPFNSGSPFEAPTALAGPAHNPKVYNGGSGFKLIEVKAYQSDSDEPLATGYQYVNIPA
jgi:hypothetical protein